MRSDQPNNDMQDKTAESAAGAPDVVWTRSIKILVGINVVFLVMIVLGVLTVLHALVPPLAHYIDGFFTSRPAN